MPLLSFTRYDISLEDLLVQVSDFKKLKPILSRNLKASFQSVSVSKGVMKALQAVLVFVFTDWAYCGRTGGDEMCFTSEKLLSLTTVVGGVIGYGIATQNAEESIRSDYQEVGDIRHNEKETLVTESHEI
jgi:hypothetical protein